MKELECKYPDFKWPEIDKWPNPDKWRGTIRDKGVKK